MTLYNKILSSNNYLATVKKIENIKFISNGKWDWEHGLGHFTRVAGYINKILVQLGADERTICISYAELSKEGFSKKQEVFH